jgi:hypothetical protein
MVAGVWGCQQCSGRPECLESRQSPVGEIILKTKTSLPSINKWWLQQTRPCMAARCTELLFLVILFVLDDFVVGLTPCGGLWNFQGVWLIFCSLIFYLFTLPSQTPGEVRTTVETKGRSFGFGPIPYNSVLYTTVRGFVGTFEESQVWTETGEDSQEIFSQVQFDCCSLLSLRNSPIRKFCYRTDGEDDPLSACFYNEP